MYRKCELVVFHNFPQPLYTLQDIPGLSWIFPLKYLSQGLGSINVIPK